MADDLDIYGDLCAAPRRPAPAEATAPALVAAPSLPRAAPPLAAAAPASEEPLLRQATPDESPAAATARAAKTGPQTWVAPGWEHLADGFVVEGGEVVSGGADAEFEALRQELATEERPVPRGSPNVRGPRASPSPAVEVSDGTGDDDDDDDGAEGGIRLGEVRASQVPARKPRLERVRWDEKQRAAEIAAGERASQSVNLVWTPDSAPTAALKPLAAGQVSPPDCFLLVGGLPPSMPNSELRALAEQFGQIRSMRVLEEPGRSRRSAGIVLFEYGSADGARRAAAPGGGLGNLSAFLALGALPRVVLVGRELLNMMRAGEPPWPEGGPCSDDLRCVLNRQFEMWNLALHEPRGRAAGAGDESPAAVGAPGAGAGDPRREGWEDKLRSLRKRVNSKTDLTADLAAPSKRERR